MRIKSINDYLITKGLKPADTDDLKEFFASSENLLAEIDFHLILATEQYLNDKENVIIPCISHVDRGKPKLSTIRTDTGDFLTGHCGVLVLAIQE